MGFGTPGRFGTDEGAPRPPRPAGPPAAKSQKRKMSLKRPSTFFVFWKKWRSAAENLRGLAVAVAVAVVAAASGPQKSETQNFWLN